MEEKRIMIEVKLIEGHVWKVDFLKADYLKSSEYSRDVNTKAICGIGKNPVEALLDFALTMAVRIGPSSLQCWE